MARGRLHLREAIGMWSGNALADLVESKILWSELTAIEDERINAHLGLPRCRTRLRAAS